MDLAKLEKYLLAKTGTTRELPFGPDVLVFKVLGKMYATLTWQEEPLRMNLKCDPELAQILRAEYEAVQPGYHMNKEHWNTVTLDGTIRDAEILQMIDNSYVLVASRLKKADREKLGL